jgi:hypothetical protein
VTHRPLYRRAVTAYFGLQGGLRSDITPASGAALRADSGCRVLVIIVKTCYSASTVLIDVIVQTELSRTASDKTISNKRMGDAHDCRTRQQARRAPLSPLSPGWLRGIGAPSARCGSARFLPEASPAPPEKSNAFCERDRWFESVFLQRRVSPAPQPFKLGGVNAGAGIGNIAYTPPLARSSLCAAAAANRTGNSSNQGGNPRWSAVPV